MELLKVGDVFPLLYDGCACRKVEVEREETIQVVESRCMVDIVCRNFLWHTDCLRKTDIFGLDADNQLVASVRHLFVPL